MAIGVQKYIKNMGKSVAYTTADVLGKKFEYISESKKENQEVFKEAYHAIKDYRTTFTRIKKAVTNNKVMDAARVGYDSVLYSISTGDFYGKQKEAEVIEKYGGSLMSGFEEFDIDNDDFDPNNEDISAGDKVLAVAIKKNSKIGTAMTVDAIAKTGKAQMDVSKENTYMLYTQQERMLNKLDGGFNNIMSFLQQNGEQTAKVQNQMNENLNKFMSSVDNNVTKLTKQMDELLEMQRNMYKPVNPEEKKKVGYDDIISRSGVINIKEYAKNVKKNAFNTVNDQLGGALSMLFGDSMGDANLLAQFAATPFRSLMEFGLNKALGAKFDKAAASLNSTLEGIIPSLISKANALGKQEDAGIMGFLGKILGVKDKSNNAIDTSKYTKGPVPFDGVTKRAITDVIPYYLRKMTSVMTGEEEQVYDFNTGRWTSMRSLKQQHFNTVNAANLSAEATLRGILEKGMGRSLRDAYSTKELYDKVESNLKSLAAKIQSNSGDFGSLKDLSSGEQELVAALKYAMRLNGDDGKDGRFVTHNGKKIRVKENSSIGGLASQLRQQRASQYSSIESINNGDSILRHIEAENLAGASVKDYRGKSYVNKYGDFDDRRVQEMPQAQALIRAKDEYGFTIFNYLRDMGSSLRFIKANSVNLNALPNMSGRRRGTTRGSEAEIVKSILSGTGADVSYNEDKSDKWMSKYYESQHTKQIKKESDSFRDRVDNAIRRAQEKNELYVVADDDEFKSHDDKTGIRRLMTDNNAKVNSKAIEQYEKDEKAKSDKRWKTIADIFGKDEANKLRQLSDKYDPEKSFKDNMANAKDQGFTSNLMMFTKIMSNKIQNPVDAMTDGILKVDYWLQNLIYGEDLSESEKKKSLFDRMKDAFQESMNKIRDAVDKGFEWVKEKMAPVFDPLKKLGERIFGKTNEDGIYEEGLLSPFISGVQKGLRKNAQDVKDYMKKQAEEAKRKLKQATGTETESEDDTEYSSIVTNHMTASELRAQSLNQKISGRTILDMKDAIRGRVGYESLSDYNNDIDNRRRRKASRTKNVTTGEVEFGSDSTPDLIAPTAQAAKIRANKSIRDLQVEIERLNSQKNIIQGDIREVEAIIASYRNQSEVPQEFIKRRTELTNSLAEINKVISTKEKDLADRKRALSKTRRWATGGINRTGRAFQSVLSAGELHNGNVVPRMGIYTINPGDTVINPAPSSVRSGQAIAERKFINAIKRNAEANDGLTHISPLAKSTDNNNTSIVPNGVGGLTTHSSNVIDVLQANFDKLFSKLDIMSGANDIPEDASLKGRVMQFIEDPERLQRAFENPLAAALSTIVSVSVPKVTNVINSKVMPWIDSKIRRVDNGEVESALDLDVSEIHTNANANDMLSSLSSIITTEQPEKPEKTAEEKAEERRNIKLLTETDWASLTDEKQKAEFLGNVASRGIIGGGLGLLVGGPLLGAAVGAASSLTKSTNAFSNMLFGTAKKDSSGMVQVDANGDVVREDDGLISKEIRDAMPDVKKLGIGGAAAGLLLGNPLLGLFLGSGLGFAKHSEMFQGTLFGEGSIFSKENVNKFKQALPNIGIGAAAGALFIPGGPFGVLGAALLGATGGYVTATDRFKDAIFGEKEDPNDPDSKRTGGVINAIKDELRPLKDFGLHLRDRVMDEIFGKDTGNGREGGLFGAIKDNVITPMIDGTRSVFDELWNKTSDMAHLLGDAYRNLKTKIAGNSFFGGLIEGADSLTGKVLHGAAGIGKLATKPFRLLGDDGIGGKFRKKRIQKGQEYTLTARERLMFRGKHKMSADDNFSESDKAIAGMSRDDLEYARALLGYNDNEDYFENKRANTFMALGQELRKNISRKDAKKIMTLIKEGRYADAEKVARTLKVEDSAKAEALKLISENKSKISNLNVALQRIEDKGGNVQDILSEMGLNVNTSNKKSMRYLDKQIKREIAHTEAGLTDEEREWDKQRDFWTNSKSPLNTVNTATSNIQKILENIYHNLSYGNEYDRLSMEKQMEYSRDEYIKMKRENAITGALQGRNMDTVFSSTTNKLGELSGKTLRTTSIAIHNITEDYLPLYTGNIKDYLAPDDVLARLNADLDAVIDKACQIFDGMVLEQLVKKEAIEADWNEAIHRIAKERSIPVDAASMEVKNLTRTNLMIVEGDKSYMIPSLTYLVSEGAKVTPKLTSKEQDNYDIVKQTYVENYVKAHTPTTVTTGYMDMKNMIKTSIRVARYLVPTVLPVPIKEFILRHPKEVIKGLGKIGRKTAFTIGRIFGSHELDNESTIQKILNDRYVKEAEKEWEKEVAIYNETFENMRHLPAEEIKQKCKFLNEIARLTPDIQSDTFGNLSQEDKEKVHKQFIDMYVQSKKDKQIFGRGMFGSTKKIVSNVVDRIKSIGRSGMKLGSIMFNASGDAADAKNRFMDKKKKQAEDMWKDMLKAGKGSKEYNAILLPILSKYYPDKSFEDLSEDEQNKIKYMFIDAWCDDAYSKLLYGSTPLLEKLRFKTQGVIYNLGNKINNRIVKKKAERKEARDLKKAISLSYRLLSKHPDEYMPKYDALAAKMYEGNKYEELTMTQRNAVDLAFYEEWKSEGGRIGEIGRSMNDKIIAKKQKVSKTMGTIKSGITNATAGKLENVRKWKEKEQEQDTLLGKFFDIMDRRAMKKEREKIEGKRDSRLARIVKWLFIGGVAAPIIVGFVTKNLLPAIHDKIQPWLKKAGEKLVGVKNNVTGEYEGGFVSGIVNPIRKFFKDKFQGVHDWFTNEGKYADSNTGMKGLLNNIKGIGEYVIELWKSGATTIYGEWLPKLFTNIGRNIIPTIGYMLKGLGEDIGDRITGKNNTKSGLDYSDFETGDNTSISTKGYSGKLNTGFGTTVELTVPANQKDYSAAVRGANNTSKTTNNDGTVTYSNNDTGSSVTSEKLSENENMYKVSTYNGADVYAKKGSNAKYLYDSESGTFVPMTDYQMVASEALGNNSALQNYNELEDSNKLQAGYGKSSSTTKAETVAKITGRSLFQYNNMAIVGGRQFLTASSKIANGSTGAVKAFGLGGKVLGGTAKTATVGFRGASKLTRSGQKVAYGTVEYLNSRLLEGLSKLSGKVSGIVKKILSSNAIQKVLPDGLRNNIAKLADGIEDIFVKVARESADDITARAGNLGGKVASKAVPLISMITSFLLGMDNCRNILGIVNPDPSISEKLCAGILNMIPDVVFTAGTAIGAASFGAAGALSAVCFALGLAGIVMLSVDGIRDVIVGGLINLFESLGINMDKIKKERQEAKEALAAVNEGRSTPLSISEYNKMIGNETNMQKFGDGIKNGWSATFGYDSSAKGDILENTENVKSDNKKVEKVRKKLATVFSSIWQHFGEKNFNYADGEGLTKKEKLNASQISFERVSGEIITELITNLNNQKDGVISDVTSSVMEYVGPIDSRKRLKNTFKEGYNNPLTQFEIDDEHAEWKRIKSIAGVCAIMNDIFDAMGDKYTISKIVVSKMIPEYFSQAETDELVFGDNIAQGLYNVNMSGYDSTADTYNTDTTTASGVIATNANANDKLSPIGNLLDKIAPSGNGLLGIVNSALTSITGGFNNIGKVFESLRIKNAETNKKIDELKLSPSDPDFWKIEVDDSNPFASALYKFTESISRVIKAPFVLSSSINAYASAAGLLQLSGVSMSSSTIASNGVSSASSLNNSVAGTNNTSSSTATKTSTTGSTTTSSKKSVFSNLVSGIKTGFTFVKGLFGFGKGKGDSDASDPYHIYQRDFNESYNTSGDSEHQSVADSGCGPASAASVLRMYGKEGSMNNAVAYALHNKYKEKDGGTYPEYFQDYLGKNGIPTNSSATNADVINNLAQGKPVILMGQNTTGAKSSPYGNKYSHYVVARGLDANGNVIIEDSEDKQGNTRYSLADTLRNTSIRITTGSGKFGRADDENTSEDASKAKNPEAVGLISLLGNYAKTLAQGVYGNFYDALYGNVTTNTSNGDAANDGSTGTTGYMAANTTGMVAGRLTTNTDVKTNCGYSSDQLLAAIRDIHPEGVSVEQMVIPALAVEKKRGLNALFTISVCIQEHGWNGNIGINRNHANYGNYNPYNIEGTPNTSNGRWKDYTSLEDGINGFADLVLGSNYYGAGLTTPYLIGNRYCPPSASENAGYSPWGESVCNVADMLVNHMPSGSGRGKGKLGIKPTKFNNINFKSLEEKQAYMDNIISNIRNSSPKYGRSKYGRADSDTTTTTSSKAKNPDAMSLLSNLGTYAKTAIKGVYGNFYDALYGNETTASNNNDGVTGSDGSTITSGAVPYDTYRHWKQGEYGTYPAPWASKSIATGGYASCANVGCAVVSAAILLAHAKAVSDSSFDPGKFIDDVVSRGATSADGCYYTLGKLINYKNEGVMTEAVDYDNVTYKAFGSNDTWQGHSSWDYIYSTLLNELNNGNYVMIKVTIKHTCMHWVALDYIDTSAKEIYIMDPGSTKEKLSEYGSSKVIGYCSFKCTKSSAKQYVLNGKRAGTGRGKSNTSASDNASISATTKKRMRQDVVTESPNGRGLTGLRSADSISTSNTHSNTTRHISGTGSNQNISSNYTSTGRATNTNIDLNQLISLISVIAQNSDKMDAIVQLLGSIAVNTESTSTAITSNNTQQKTPTNGLTALRNALGSSGSNVDIANAVYQIARS